MEYNEKLCEEKHKAIDGELIRHSKWLGDHEKKIDNLERSDACNTVQIGNLTKAIGSQTKAIWGLVSAVLITLIGAIVSVVLK